MFIYQEIYIQLSIQKYISLSAAIQEYIQHGHTWHIEPGKSDNG